MTLTLALTYVRYELIPGLDAPMSLPVFSMTSGFSAPPDQSSIQTVLALGTSSHPDGGSSAVAPPMDMEGSPLLETGLPGCPFRFTPYSGRSFEDGNPAFGLQLHHPRFLEFVGGTRSARLLCHSPTFWVDQLGREQAMAAAVNLQRDAGIMLSNLQILSQFAMSLSHMSSDMMDLGIGQMVFPHDEVAGLPPATRATRAAKYMTAMGLWRSQTDQTDSGPVPTSTCRSCMLYEYCFPGTGSLRSSVYYASDTHRICHLHQNVSSSSSSIWNISYIVLRRRSKELPRSCTGMDIFLCFGIFGYVMFGVVCWLLFLTCWGLLASFSLVASLRGVLPVM